MYEMESMMDEASDGALVTSRACISIHMFTCIHMSTYVCTFTCFSTRVHLNAYGYMMHTLHAENTRLLIMSAVRV